MNTSKNKRSILSTTRSTFKILITCLFASAWLLMGCHPTPSKDSEKPPRDSTNLSSRVEELNADDYYDSTQRRIVCAKPDAIIGIDLARERRRALIGSSKLDTIINSTPELGSRGMNGRTSYHINLDTFISLLTDFRDNTKRYNGMRVHFACFPQTAGANVPAERVGQLVLLFVPTEFVTSTNRRKDDTAEIYALYEDKKIKLTEGEARQWVANYQNKLRNQLQLGGRITLGSTNFEETRSHWYFMETLRGNGIPEGQQGHDPGLIAFLHCKKKDPRNPIVRAEVVFAAFLRGEATGIPEHQLTVLFRFHPREGEDKFRSQEKLFRSEPYTFGSIVTRQDNGDTGFPCPPATNCDGSFTEPPTLKK